ncbi:hypothetical protein APY03_3237 [Variovorax sp. WDL1]|nr:hypothetical protein APY03_3237 [Variovorax sp. WDL1]
MKHRGLTLQQRRIVGVARDAKLGLDTLHWRVAGGTVV